MAEEILRFSELMSTLLLEEIIFGLLKLKKLKKELKKENGTYSPKGTNFCLSNFPFNFPKDNNELLIPSSLFVLLDNVPK